MVSTNRTEPTRQTLRRVDPRAEEHKLIDG